MEPGARVSLQYDRLYVENEVMVDIGNFKQNDLFLTRSFSTMISRARWSGC